MRIFILLLVLFVSLVAKAQQPVMETVGSPTTSVPVNTYTGWANAGTVTYTGNAEVQNLQPCTIVTSTGGGNVFFTNTPGIFFEISFSVTFVESGYLGLDFALRNYNAATPNELVVEYSLNSSSSYQPFVYHPYTGNFFANGAWDLMTSQNQILLSAGTTSIKIRFRQTSATDQFRIDDIYPRFTFLLPINLISFSSVSTNNNAMLNWTTNSNSASDSFILERSNDAISFSAINTQTAKGSGTYSYTYTDASLISSSKVFYRLQMKNVSGKISYSNILAVNTGKKRSDLIESLYPSPATNSTTIALNAAVNEIASIEIFDAAGRKVKTQTSSISQGLNSILIDVSMLKTGTYILKASTKEQIQSMSLVVVR